MKLFTDSVLQTQTAHAQVYAMMLVLIYHCDVCYMPCSNNVAQAQPAHPRRLSVRLIESIYLNIYVRVC